MEKDCTVCGVRKSLEQFGRAAKYKDGRRTRCKACDAAYAKMRREKYPDTVRAAHRRWLQNNPESAARAELKHKLKAFAMSLEEYDRLFAVQGGKCAICRAISDRRLCVDHDHVGGRVRGLLCHHCNLVLGHAKDSLVVLSAAMEYLKCSTEPATSPSSRA